MDFDLDGIEPDLGFQPIYGQIGDNQGQVSTHGEHGFEPEAGPSALTKVTAMMPADLTAAGGKAIGAVTDGVRDAVKVPSFMSILAFINPSTYGKPATVSAGAKRLRQNVMIYKRNYIWTMIALFGLTIITSPSLLFPLAIVGGIWTLLLAKKDDPDNPPMKFGPFALNQRNKCLMAAPFTFLFLWWIASGALMWAMALTGMIVIVQGTFHEAPAHMKAAYQEKFTLDLGRLPTHRTSIPRIDPQDPQAVDEEWWDLQ